MASSHGLTCALAHLSDLANMTKDFNPRIEYFPNYYPDLDKPYHVYDVNPSDDDEPEESDLSGDVKEKDPDGADCLTTCQDWKKFLESQEVGLDKGYKCPKCRECGDCRKGEGLERMSMRQEAEQEVICSSVWVDKETNRAVCKLAFMADPERNLKPNRGVASKRLDNVCQKYAKEPNVRKMIVQAIDKLKSRGHLKLWDNLSEIQKTKIQTAPASHYLCWDVGFKEESLSTPARPVFDASATTPGGTSLNQILAKGNADLVKLWSMMADWTMGPLALTGDVSQAYNSIKMLHEMKKESSLLRSTVSNA